jgi:hypothetical protein
MWKIHLREIYAAGSGYSPDMAVRSHSNEPSGFVKSAIFGRSVTVPTLCHVVPCSVSVDVWCGHWPAFDPTRESRDLFQRNFICRFVPSYSPCRVQDKVISTKSVRTLRRLLILCTAAGGRQLEWKRPKHATNCRLPAAVHWHRMSNASCAVTDFLLNIFLALSVPVLVQVAQHYAHAQTRVSAPLQQPAEHSSWRRISWRNL